MLDSFTILKPDIYEQLINLIMKEDLDSKSSSHYSEKYPIDNEDAPRVLTMYLAEIIERNLKAMMQHGKGLQEQVQLTNKILDSIGCDQGYNPYLSNSYDRVDQLLALVERKNSMETSREAPTLIRPISFQKGNVALHVSDVSFSH